MKILTALVLVCATLLPATSAPAAVAGPASSTLVSAKDDKPDKPEKAKPKPKKTKKPKNPDSSRGGNPPANSNGKGRAKAPGQVKKGAGSNGTATGNAGQGNGNGNANPRSENENKKITFCHVPPGNPDNGHAITTSVNAITPGHTNHAGDIIPPFSYTKQGKLVSFPGQNWGPDAQAIIDNDCKTPDASSTDPSADPSADPTPTEGQVESANQDLPAKAVASATDKSSRTGFVDGLLPNTGGGRLAVLLVGLALLAGGALLLVRRRSALSD
ncbi:hypothetical protein ASD11_03420 [Aeromicrobium sp. Root495]|uniref:LPXTG cell wall anchor domain-containing protein n=1 Tax=Aeromicrobium sp. Root495 TaxID=1736550 RepID=UPI0006FFCE20|nr:LPXTG cell wall anchor domain-containing protein [Aeromicrobium sp. Root495]KQY58711.1 hypothetical protein ASD11_03420 [Aeromicrobium sp. Root495]